MRWRLCLPLLYFSTLAVLGCNSGPETGEVSGTVTFKGQPVKEGALTFMKQGGNGGNYEADIRPDGKFAVVGRVEVGEYKIEVRPLMELKDTDPGKTPKSMVEKNVPDVPRKYRQQGTTPLKETVKRGKNDFKFDMTP
jgi:hypothetical protein